MAPAQSLLATPTLERIPFMSSTPHHPPVVAIFGPTGTGKTEASVDLALQFNGQIVNADSRYLYRSLHIGVAKPTLEERKGVRHHLIDVYEPTEVATIAEVQRLAYQAIEEVTAEGMLPILVGGTPLYMNAITEGWSIPEVPPDWDFRTGMDVQVQANGVEWLADQVRAIDVVSSERSAANPRRLIRALEVFRATGIPMSVLESKNPPPYRFLNIGLSQPRDILYERLDRRVDHHIATGLIDEVRGLLDSGLTGDEPAFSAIGYRQLVSYLRDEIDLDEAIRETKVATHRYVRHQTTWLRKRADLIPFDTSESGWQVRLGQTVADFLTPSSTSEP